MIPFGLIRLEARDGVPRREWRLIFRCISDLLFGLEALRPIGGALQYGSLTTNAESSGETAHETGKYFYDDFSELEWLAKENWL